MGCGSLLISSQPDCATPFQGGVGNDSRLILIERNDIAGITYTGLDVISAITLVSGASAWAYSGFKQSLKPNYKRVQAPSGQSMYQHGAEYFVYDYSQTIKNNLQRKANGRYLAIFENAKQDANTFEAMGVNVGVEVLELERMPQENGGAFRIVLQTPENEFEGKLPNTVLSTDYAGTLALLNGYLYLPTITASGLSITTAPAATPTAITITGTNFFAGGSNSGVLKVQLVNQLTGAIVPFTANPTVTNTTVALNTPVTVAGTYKVQILTIKGWTNLSLQNLILT